MKGKLVTLRPVERADLEFCQMLYNHDQVRQMVVGWDFPTSRAAQEKWFESSLGDKSNIRLMIETREGQTIGLTGLWDIDWHNRHALTAVKLIPEGTGGKGYGRDAIMAMNAYAFCEVGLNRLWGAILDFNVPSFKSYVVKSGWKVEGMLREHVFRNGVYHDLYYVGCLKEDFLSVPDARDYMPPEIPAGMSRIKAHVDVEHEL